jgi:cbb3-type cytochrome oxidase subunit 1
VVRVLGLPALHRHRRHRLSLGVTQSKEYAEPEWYVDLWLTVVWVVYLLVFLGTL